MDLKSHRLGLEVGFLAGLLLASSLAGFAQQSGRETELATIFGIVVRIGTAEPIANAYVELFDSDLGTIEDFEGNFQLRNMTIARNPPQGTTTDSSGRFVFEDVEPGSYRLAAVRDGYVREEYGSTRPAGRGEVVPVDAGEYVDDIQFSMERAPTISGWVYGVDDNPMAGVLVEAFRLRYTKYGVRALSIEQKTETDDRGEFRLFWLTPGEYLIRATYSEQAGGFRIVGGRENPNLEPAEEGFPPIYYPSALGVDQALPIILEEGRDIGAIDIRIERLPAVSISGVVMDPGTAPPGGEISLAVAPRFRSQSHMGSVAFYYRADREGRFSIENLAPGSYVLMATKPGPQRLSANVALAAVTDIRNMVLTLHAGVALQAQARFESAVGFGPPPFDLSGVFLLLYPPGGMSGSLGAGPLLPNGQVRFTQPVGLGRYEIVVRGLPEGYFLKSAEYLGVDALEAGLEITADREGLLDLVISDRSGSAGGIVVNRGDRPIRRARVVLIPTGSLEGRRDLVFATNTDDEGRFRVKTVPPGEYDVYAWEDVEPNAYYNSDFMKRFEGRGERIVVEAGDTASLRVRVIPRRETRGGRQ